MLLFGVAALVRPGMSLSTFVLAFGTYALVDGVAAVAEAIWTVEHSRKGIPLLAGGVVSVAVGATAWAWPFAISPVVLIVIALGSTAVGVLELLAALYLLRDLVPRWLFGVAGAASLFLGVGLTLLPLAGTDSIVPLVGLYAVAFGVVATWAAAGLRSAKPQPSLETAHSKAA